MLTPRFNLSQNEKTLTIIIRAPYCSLRDLDIEIDGEVFLFVCKPYYLRLNLPGRIKNIDLPNNTLPNSSYDTDNGEFTFILEKYNHGEVFKDLEFITKFLSPKLNVETDGTKIEILTNNEECQEIESNDCGYGFAMRSNHDFALVSYEFDEVFDVDPRKHNLTERKRLRLEDEQNKFDGDHYLCDLIECDEIQELIQLKQPQPDDDKLVFTAKELDFLKDLPNRQYKLNEKQLKYCHNGLLDILFAYCYERRMNSFEEPTIESGWTINKLSATLSWLEGFETVKETIVSAFRRSLIFPLYRNYEYSKIVLNDLKQLVKSGEQYLIRCLIEIYRMFVVGDCCRYILNNLFIKDYIVYIMKWNQDGWQEVVEQLTNVDVTKEELGLNLIEIEDGGDVSVRFAQMRIDENDSDDDSDDETSDSSDSTSTDD